MISRRNIRIKVLQCLYAIRNGNELPFAPKVQMAGESRIRNTKPDDKADKGVVMLRQQFDLTKMLFYWQALFITEVARYAEHDAMQRASKHLPSHEDLSVATRISGNSLLWRMLESDLFKQAKEKYGMLVQVDAEEVRKVYLQLVQSTPYAVYNSAPERDKKQDKEILEFIYSDLMLADDDWTEYAEDLFPNWDDDAEMLQPLMLQFLSKPGVFKMDEMITQDKFEFARLLLDSVQHKGQVLDEWIKPKLRNWDMDRVAQLDLIMLQMGVAEFLYFETIPPKATLNEYIDLAKAYSTPQSGQFVNGILDGVRKEMESAGKMEKVDYKKQR